MDEPTINKHERLPRPPLQIRNGELRARDECGQFYAWRAHEDVMTVQSCEWGMDDQFRRKMAVSTGQPFTQVHIEIAGEFCDLALIEITQYRLQTGAQWIARPGKDFVTATLLP